MINTITIIAILISLTLILGSITQWIVHKLHPQKNSGQLKQEGILKNFSDNALMGFIITAILNILFFSGVLGIVGAFCLIATLPAMVIFGIAGVAHFFSR